MPARSGPPTPSSRGSSAASAFGERVAPVAGAGVHDEPRELVDYEQVVVLVLKVEWEVCAPEAVGLRLRGLHHHALTGAYLLRGL